MASSIVRSTAKRAVHLKITPRPADLEQSREILKLISRFGEVEYYRNLRYDALTHPHVALVIFKRDQDAYDFQKKAPIRFRMGRAGPREEPRDGNQTASDDADASDPSVPIRRIPTLADASFEVNQKRSMSTAANAIPQPPPRPPVIPLQDEHAESQPLLDSRMFQIITSPARSRFRDRIDAAAFHGGFSSAPRAIAQRALAAVVPIPGLCRIDWNEEERAWRNLLADKEKEHSGPLARKSLTEIYDERLKAPKPP
ncbi:uncharacterized protein K489DRAFT_384569 [Dissoconium aciculare CBS 342.82]|jgi:hypothetical protein|uniref:Uncharacterized protein n=1 Tax=Dissoconium aciculare CBS 342.82 TaxID=1314786 RepID=A0A6J3LVK5_9PEZI|nr:uncharacterized protein K489DRAFT_384569 [Dissoconium aciculare CBS 342.82]KAF1818652.1 hypothetical protein K489DRAFT_384569 [Dissoconium aciculare CBS 342.82]